MNIAPPKISSKSVTKSPGMKPPSKPEAPKAPKAGQSLTQKDAKKSAESIKNAEGIDTELAVKDAKAKKETLTFNGHGQWQLHTKK